MKFGVVVFPGSNCDHDMIYTLESTLQQEVKVLWHKETNIDDFNEEDWIVLPGGFSYGDYLRSGAIARFSPIMNEVIAFGQNGGNLLGICNGFQILCEAGLLPGVLIRNSQQKFICKNVYIKPQSSSNALTAGLDPAKAYKIPIASGEGCYYADAGTLSNMEKTEQILFRYCDENGQITDKANPNGSIGNIAGVCNETKNVFGMMPHPERAADKILGNTDGLELFQSILDYKKESVTI